MIIREDQSLMDNYDSHFTVLCAEISRLRMCLDHFRFLAKRGEHNEDLNDFTALHAHITECLRPSNSILEELPDYPGDVFREMGLWPKHMEELNTKHQSNDER